MKYVILTTFGLIVLFFGVYYGVKLMHGGSTPVPVATTTDNNTGDNTSASSTDTSISGWKTFTDNSTGVSFQYPEKLGTTYIDASDWPPKVQVMSGSFSCTTAGNTGDRAGQTMEKTINGTQYCVTTVSEGAAGSIYNQYAYAFEKAGEMAILTFTLRLPQCANYPEPKMSECNAERQSFNIDTIVDSIAKSLTLNAFETTAS